MTKVKELKKNRVSINLSSGCVEIESNTESLENVLSKTHFLSSQIHCDNSGSYVLLKEKKVK